MGTYKPPAGDGLQPLVDKLNDLQTQLLDLQRPSGTNLGNTAAQVQALVTKVNETLVNINATVTASIAANSYTKAVIDGKVANPPAGSAVTGNVSATGTGTFGGVVTADAGMSSLDARNRVLSSSYGSVYADGSGRFGQAPSSRRFKQDITPTTVDPKAVYAAEIVNFRYIGAVVDEGNAAVVEIGGIAEQFEACGLGQFVARDSDGAVFGIQYERLTVALIATVQSLNARLVKLGG